MEEQWDKLTAVLNEIRDVCQEMLELARQKKTLLVAAKAGEVEVIVKKEEAFALRLRKLEGIREKTVREMGVALHLSQGKVTLAQLVSFADERHAEQLAEVGKELDATARELSDTNKLNSLLIQHALDFVNFNINILMRAVADPVYSAKGQDAKPGRQTMTLDRKA